MAMIRILVGALLATAVVFSANAQEDEALDLGTYHALVIGNNEYQHMDRLETAVSDAAATAELLKLKYGYRVKLILNATRSQTLYEINRLRGELEPTDRLLIYYAGHGTLDRETNTGYWLPVDAEEENDVNWIAISAVSRHLKAMAAAHVMVVSDSCYSGTLVRSGQAKIPTGKERMAYLRRMASKRARTALVSGGLEPVADAGSGGHSVFAAAFLSALRDNDTILDGQELFHKVRQSVVLDADQTPQYSNIRFAGHEGGDFLFVPAGISVVAARTDGGESAAPVGVDSAQIELTYWSSIEDSNNAEDYESFLKSFPEENFSELARNRLKRYAALTPNAAAPPASPLPPPTPLKAIEVEPMDSVFWATVNANVREAPATDAGKVSTLPRGSQIEVTGKAADWYRVAVNGKMLGYVFGSLLSPEEPPDDASVTRGVPAVPRIGAPGEIVPGRVVRDCDVCPELVVLPRGAYLMGSAEGDADERPIHQIAVGRAFAIGKHEVTFDQWQACADAGGCQHNPYDEGWGQGARPVINVNWHDARAYTKWLSKKTGRNYRLPTEAEWEYAARAGATNSRSMGRNYRRACLFGNVADREMSRSYSGRSTHDCTDKYVETAPVGKYRPNAFGIHDMLGNVWEWVGDCYNPNTYASSSGRVTLVGAMTSSCDRIIRGGSWGSGPGEVRPGNRDPFHASGRANDVGIRVVRE